jgi:choline dehydrogenase
MKVMTRRAFAALCAKSGIGLAVLLSGCARIAKKKYPETPITCKNQTLADEYEYIIVGSGAGGGPLAANLARQGYKVLLMEAGGDDENDNYKVPLFHPLASEDPSMRWDFFVRHYEEDEKSLKDCKYSKQHAGVLYPRSGTLGGCTAHNAMVFVYPHNSDWDYIAKLLDDPSWASGNMRKYFERLENCQHVDRPKNLSDNPSRHGFNGWLTTNIASKDIIWSVLKDKKRRKEIFKSVFVVLKQDAGNLLDVVDILKSRIDPNDWRKVKESAEGLCLMPLTTRNGNRVGSREYIKAVEQACADNLTVKLHAFVTKVILDENNTATGVEYLEGKRLYRADRTPLQNNGDGVKHQIKALREVILCGGAFNTPQLLMLSGIGPANALKEHNIDVRINLAGVGENLQDRYEVGIVTEMKKDFSMLDGVTFKTPEPGESDAIYADWQLGKGIYTTNGAVVSFIKKSLPGHTEPDLFIFGMPGAFKGYYPNYSIDATNGQNHFTWAILKAHTNNTAGTVKLKSNDPLDVPDINFRYFDEGNDLSGEDLKSVVEGVNYVRHLNKRADNYIEKELIPGEHIKTKTELEEFVKYNAWGHHASCSCKMGTNSDSMAVVDAKFRVFGTHNLRVVDASIFPKIPGFFIVSAIYMVSEKAFDIIHEDAVKTDNMVNNDERNMAQT